MKKLLVTLAALSCFNAYALEQECQATMQRTSPTAGFIDNQNGTVTDRATKLTWMRCSIGQQFNAETASCDGTPDVMYWQGALQTAEKVRSSEDYAYYQFADISNWRVPNAKELISIRELACANPALNNAIFPNSMAIAEAEGGYVYVWTSTPLAFENGIMVMDLNGGALYATGSPLDYERQVLLVADEK